MVTTVTTVTTVGDDGERLEHITSCWSARERQSQSVPAISRTRTHGTNLDLAGN